LKINKHAEEIQHAKVDPISIQEEDKERIQTMIEDMESGKQIGTNTLEEMKIQTKQLDNIEKKIENIDDLVEEGGKRIRTLIRRSKKDVIIYGLLCIIIVVLLVSIGTGMYYGTQ
jgi:t-SNARE complex subunit (syntaxin)